MSAELLEALKRCESVTINVDEIAPILGTNPHDIRRQAHDRPELLGFPVVVLGSRVKVVRKPFIEFCERLPPVIKIMKQEEPHP